MTVRHISEVHDVHIRLPIFVATEESQHHWKNNVRQLHMNLLRDESKTIQVEVWLGDGFCGSMGFHGVFFFGGGKTWGMNQDSHQFAPENRPAPKRKRSYSNHPFLGAFAVSFREGRTWA